MKTVDIEKQISIGHRIKARREELGFTQDDLAKEINLDQGKVSLIERGLRKIDSVNELPLIAKFLRCPISWFYQDENFNETDPFRILMNEFFPGIEFSEFELAKLRKILQILLDAWVGKGVKS